jgi:hypothetical protein
MSSVTTRTQKPHNPEPNFRPATWHDLPPEITDKILYYICEYIVEEYEMYGRDPWNPEYQDYAPIMLGPEGPYPLCLYTNLLQTCRSFYHAIKHVVKIDGERVADVLQNVQYNALSQILDGLYDHRHSPTFWFRIVPITVKLIGFFWNNPLIRADYIMMVDLFLIISHREGANLIPYFENFFLDLVKEKGSRSVRAGSQILLEPAVYLRIGTRTWSGDGVERVEVMTIAGIEGFNLSNRGLKPDGLPWTGKDMQSKVSNNPI